MFSIYKYIHITSSGGPWGRPPDLGFRHCQCSQQLQAMAVYFAYYDLTFCCCLEQPPCTHFELPDLRLIDCFTDTSMLL